MNMLYQVTVTSKIDIKLVAKQNDKVEEKTFIEASEKEGNLILDASETEFVGGYLTQWADDRKRK